MLNDTRFQGDGLHWPSAFCCRDVGTADGLITKNSWERDITTQWKGKSIAATAARAKDRKGKFSDGRGSYSGYSCRHLRLS